MMQNSPPKSVLKIIISLAMVASLLMLSGCIITEKFEKISADYGFNPLILRANAAMHEGDWNKAAALYERAAQVKPDQLEWRVKQAQAYQAGGNLAQAFNVYQLIVDSSVPAGSANEMARKLAITELAKLGYKRETMLTLIESKPVHQETEPTIEDELAEPSVKDELAEPPPSSTKIVTVDADKSTPLSIDKSKVELLEATKAVFDEFNGWRGAWESKNMKAYFAHYLDDFSGDASSSKAWRDGRKAKIMAAKNIQVTFSDAQVNFVAEDVAELKFKQHYRSGSYKDVGNKILHFKKQESRWLIAQESFK